MKSEAVTLLLALLFATGTIHAQDKGQSNHQMAPAKTEKSSETSKSSSKPCCPEMKAGTSCDQMGNKTTKTDQTKKDSSITAVYTCPMHPEVKSDKPGKCPKCGMDLVKKK